MGLADILQWILMIENGRFKKYQKINKGKEKEKPNGGLSYGMK